MQNAKKYEVSRTAEVPPVKCPCGLSRRSFADDPDKKVSLHIVDIQQDAKKHYHKVMTEIYYILEGEGLLELDDDVVPVESGVAVMVKPFCRHRAVGGLKIMNIVVPAFDENDEWFD